MLFGKNRKLRNKEEQKCSLDGKNRESKAVPDGSKQDTSATSTGGVAEKRKTAAELRAAMEQRIKRNERFASVMGRMFRLIVSADLTYNSYFTESGSLRILGENVADRGWYDSMYNLMMSRIHTDDAERFEALFSREELSRLIREKDSVTGSFRFQYPQYASEAAGRKEAEDADLNTTEKVEGLSVDESDLKAAEAADTESIKEAERVSADDENVSSDDIRDHEAPEIRYVRYEIRADRIRDIAEPRICCMIYVREVQLDRAESDEIAASISLISDPGDPADSEDNAAMVVGNMLTRSFLSRKDMLFAEYETETDKLTIIPGESGTAEREISFFTASPERISDSLIHHEDVETVFGLIDAGKKWKNGSAEVRLRLKGLHEDQMSSYLINSYPSGDRIGVRYITFIITDLNSRKKPVNKKDRLSENGSEILKGLFAGIFELDFTRDQIEQAVINDGGLRRQNKPYRLGLWVDSRISKSVIGSNSIEMFRSICSRTFLEKNVRNGRYSAEVEMKLPGSTEYRWYEILVRAEEGETGKYLHFYKDINELKLARDARNRLNEQYKFANYNRSALEVLAGLVEFRSVETGTHIIHVKELTRIILEDIANRSPQYGLDKKKIEIYSEAAVLHDIGKLTVPDSILNKEGRLTPEETEIMRSHTINGAIIVDRMWSQGNKEMYVYSRDIVLHHHERYDGNGYPDGLVGDEISIGAQAVAIMDVYDALTSERVYKSSISHEDAVSMICEGKCGVFNPRLLESLKACSGRIKELYNKDGKETRE